MSRPLTLLVGLLLSSVLTGCGEPQQTDGPSDDTSASSDAAFRQCLSEQGLELPEADSSSSPDPSQLDPAVMQRAMEACGDLAPDGLPGLAGGTGGPDESAVKAFRQCLAKREVKVEADLTAIQQLDLADPKVRRAFDACSGLIGQ